jgi:hypothetical protein
MLRRSPAKFNAWDVYFLTDLQRATWAARPSSDLAATLQQIQAKARTVFVDVGQDQVGNLAVVNLALGTPLTLTGAVTPRHGHRP